MIELDGMRDDVIKLTLLKLLPHGHPDMGKMPILFFRIRLLDDTWIGSCDLRLGDSDITEVLGHMGYSIDEQYRGHHYAEHACRLMCDYARRANMTQLDITCDIDNYASIRTCERLGAEKIATIDVPPGFKTYDDTPSCGKKYKFRVML